MKNYSLYTRDRNCSEYRPYDIVKKETDIAAADIYEAAQKADVLITEKKRIYEGLDFELCENEKRLAVRLFYRPNPFGRASEEVIDSKAIKVTDTSFWRGWFFIDADDVAGAVEIISVADAAAELGRTRQLIYGLIKQGRLEVCGDGITRDSFERYKATPKRGPGRKLGSKNK